MCCQFSDNCTIEGTERWADAVDKQGKRKEREEEKVATNDERRTKSDWEDRKTMYFRIRRMGKGLDRNRLCVPV